MSCENPSSYRHSTSDCQNRSKWNFQYTDLYVASHISTDVYRWCDDWPTGIGHHSSISYSAIWSGILSPRKKVRHLWFNAKKQKRVFRYWYQVHLFPGTSITIHFHVRPGTVALPVTRLIDAVGYVTSPRYDGLHSVYLQRYNGYFHLQVSDNEFILIKFIHFTLQPITLRPVISPWSDYLEFNASALNHRWKKCGTQIIPSQVLVPQYTSSSIPTERKSSQGSRWCTPFFPGPKSPSPRSCQIICTTAPSPGYTSSSRCSAVIW